jgi:type IV pilus assembly protein PilP
VIVGEYVGTIEGRIMDITPSRIALSEIIPDGLGGYIERPAALALNE